MKINYLTLLIPTVSAIAALFAIPAQANFSWSYVSNGSFCPGDPDTCTRTDTDNSVTINVTAQGLWSDGINGNLSYAPLRVWDGLSVGDEGTVPQHATDNSGKLESVLFSFDKAVDITSITMGWHEDSDFSLLRYTGNGTPINFGSSTYNNLESNGWELVGNYLYSGSLSSETDLTAAVYGSAPDNFDGPKDENNSAKSPTNTSSSYWLVAAINGAFWNNSAYIGNDYFKLKSLVAVYTPPPNGGVPEPSTLALISIAVAGIGFTRRKKKNV